jgi:GT2 family glycosyltransferase
MKLSVLIPVYDNPQEAADMIQKVRQCVSGQYELEFLLADISGNWADYITKDALSFPVRYFRAANLPAAKNQSATEATGEFLLFLFPGIFPMDTSIQTMIGSLEDDRTLTAVAGRWVNAKGKLEVGYNVRRFPTFTALIIDILLLNKLFPRNRFTRRYKMHDFDHSTPICTEHANDCVFLLRKETILRYGGFNEEYAIGWLDQVEFCESASRAGGRILYEPMAAFVSNENIPLINRLVRDRYPEYRHAEYLYIRNRFGPFAALIARVLVAVGMLQRLGFTFVLPGAMRGWFLASLGSYVNDKYVHRLRRDYWTVLKRSVRGEV